MFPSYRNKSTDLQSKSIDWFLYGHNIVRKWVKIMTILYPISFNLLILTL